MPHQDEGAREMKHAQEIVEPVFPPDCKAAVILEPRKQYARAPSLIAPWTSLSQVVRTMMLAQEILSESRSSSVSQSRPSVCFPVGRPVVEHPAGISRRLRTRRY
jgi:hypothetical protein